MDALKNIPSVDNFRAILWEYQGYYVILVPLTVIEFYYDAMIIVNNKEFFLKIKNSKVKSSLVFISIGALIATDFVLFRVGIIGILADQYPVVITNKQNFQFWTTMSYIIIYSGIPIVQYFLLWGYKRSFSIKNEFNHYRFKISLIPGTFVICMSFIFSLVTVTVQDYANGFLK